MHFGTGISPLFLIKDKKSISYFGERGAKLANWSLINPSILGNWDDLPPKHLQRHLISLWRIESWIYIMGGAGPSVSNFTYVCINFRCWTCSSSIQALALYLCIYVSLFYSLSLSSFHSLYMYFSSSLFSQTLPLYA